MDAEDHGDDDGDGDEQEEEEGKTLRVKDRRKKWRKNMKRQGKGIISQI